MTAKTLTLRLLAALGTSVLFVVAAGAALVLHADLPAGRRVLARLLSNTLEANLLGQFTIGAVERVDVSGILVRDLVVLDPAGRRVLRLQRLRAQADLRQIASDLLFARPTLRIVIDHVHATRADVTLIEDPKTSGPTLLAAFTPRPSTRPPSATPTRELEVVVHDIELSRAQALGGLFGLHGLALDASSVRGRVRVTPAGAEVIAMRFGTSIRGLGPAELRGVGSVRVRAPGSVWTSFDGYVGKLQVGSTVRVDDNRLLATLVVPKAEPADVRALVPGYPLLEPASVEVEVSGALPYVVLDGSLRAGQGTLLGSGPIRLSNGLTASLELEGRNMDLRLALPQAPSSRLDFLGTVQLTSTPMGIAATLAAATEPTTIAGQGVPAVDVTTTIAAGTGEVRGRALVHEPGLPLRSTFRRDKTGVVTIAAESNRFFVERVPRLARALPVRGQATLRGTARIEGSNVHAELEGNVAGVNHAGASLERASIVGKADGKLSQLGELRVDVNLTGSRLGVGSLSFDRVAARATGPVTRPKLQLGLGTRTGTEIRAEARVKEQGGHTRVDELVLLVQRESEQLQGRATRIELGEERLQIDGLALEGLGGKLTGSARIGPNVVSVQAQGEGLDLAAVSRLFDVASRPRGRVSFDADVIVARDLERGTAHLELEDVAVGPLDGLSGTAEATLEHGKLTGAIRASVAGLGKAELRVDTTLGGSALTARAYRDLTGQAELDVNGLDLSVLGGGLAAVSPIAGLSGQLDVRARLQRQVPYALPNLTLTANTRSLVIAHEAEPETVAESEEPSTVRGLNVFFGTSISGESGESDLAAQLVDEDGILASASLRGTVDLVRALRAPHALPDQLLNTPVLGKLIIADRSLATLPELIRPDGISGRLRADATLDGTLSTPRLTAKVDVATFGIDAVRNQRPVDLCTQLGWEPRTNRVISSGEAFLSAPARARCTGTRVLRYSLDGRITSPSANVGLRLRGSGAAALEGLPLDAIPGLGDSGLTGRAFGSVSIADDAGIPSVSASVDLRETQMHGVPIGDGKLKVQSDPRALGATLSFVHDGGELKATAISGLDFSQALPRLDPAQPIRLRVVAQRANAVVLSPFVRDVLSEIDGRVDADVTTTLYPGAQGDKREAGEVVGFVNLHDANVQLATLGLRLAEVTVRARAESEGGETRITVDQLSGRGGSNKERVGVREGKLWLKGLSVVRAEGNLDTTEMPLLLEGVPQATATTRQSVAFRLERKPERMEVVFQIPYLLVALPQSAGRNVISLAENDAIEIVQPIGEPTSRGGEALPWLLRFELGRNVKLTRSDLDLPLTGTAEVLLGREVEVTGDLDLISGGRLQVSDKTFVIESGEVHFDTGDPGNPRIRVTASWRAPDDTLVYADVAGTLEEAELRLASDRGLNQQEIQMLLSGYGGTGEQLDAGAAGAIVGAQQILSPLLANTPLSKVEIRAGAQSKADRSYATYTAAVPLTDEVWFEGSYHAPTASQAEQYGSAVSGTVDWRFRRNWSLRTELGTLGTGLDLVWQYRY